jgi:hypothetical protein
VHFAKQSQLIVAQCAISYTHSNGRFAAFFFGRPGGRLRGYSTGKLTRSIDSTIPAVFSGTVTARTHCSSTAS